MWIQLIHYVIYTYPTRQDWYNWGGIDPPSEEDKKGLKLPHIPGLPSLPGIPQPSLPGKPDLPGMPGMPSLPGAPDIHMPSLPLPGMPSIPGLPGLPGLPGGVDMPKINMKKPKKRNKDGPWSRFEIYKHGSYKPIATQSGKKITIKGCTVTEYFAEGDDEDQKEIVLEAKNDEQATSWLETLYYGGCGGGLDDCRTFGHGQDDGGVYICRGGCGAGGNVWGSGPYTNDSDGCAAAKHAGILKESGGRYQGKYEIKMCAGQEAWSGSLAHGVQSMDYGNWPNGYTVHSA